MSLQTSEQATAATSVGSQPASFSADFSKAEKFLAKNMRQELLDELILIVSTARGSRDVALRAVKIALDAGAFGFAKDVLDSLSPAEQVNPLIQAYRAKTAALRDPFDGAQAVMPLLDSNVTDFEYWLVVSEVAQRVLDSKLALRLTRRAAFLGGGANPEAQFRYAEALKSCGQFRAAAHILSKLLLSPIARTNFAHRLAELALSCGRPKLALKFAEGWMQSSPNDDCVALLCCRYMMASGKTSHVQDYLQTLQRKLANGHQIDATLFGLAIDYAQALDKDLRLKLALEAIKRFPSEERFATIVKPDHFAEMFVISKTAPRNDSANLVDRLKRWARHVHHARRSGKI